MEKKNTYLPKTPSPQHSSTEIHQTQKIETLSAEDVLVKLIKEVEMALPHLKDKLQEAFPQSFDGKTLEIIVDAEAEKTNFQVLEKERSAIENCLRRIVPWKSPKLSIIKKNEILSPYETVPLHSRDIRALKEKAEKNEFVKDILKRFNGKIIDVWGA